MGERRKENKRERERQKAKRAKNREKGNLLEKWLFTI
jgi:hypothetical protein